MVIKSANACGIRISFRPDSLRILAHCLESVRLYPVAMLCLCDGCSASQPNDPSNRYGNRCCTRDSSKRDLAKRIVGRTTKFSECEQTSLRKSERPTEHVAAIFVLHSYTKLVQSKIAIASLFKDLATGFGMLRNFLNQSIHSKELCVGIGTVVFVGITDLHLD